MKKMLWLLFGSATIMLMTSMAFASDGKAEVAGKGIISKILNFADGLLTPEPDHLVLWLICFPLTVVWLIWSSNKTKTGVNNIGVSIIFGGAALSLFFPFYGPIIYFVIKIYHLVMYFTVGSWTWDGFWSHTWQVIVMVPTLIMISIISKLPFIRELVTTVLTKVKEYSIKIWDKRKDYMETPNVFFMIIGGSVIATLFNGEFAVNITNMPEKSNFLIAGIIPSISGMVGVFFLLFRTVFGQRMVAKMRQKPGPNNEWACTSRVFKHNRKGEIYFEGVLEPRHYSLLAQAEAEGLVPKMVRCNTLNFEEDHSCRSAWCNHRNPFLPWDCLNPDCTEVQIPWDKPKCICGTRQLERLLITPPCTPDTDFHSRQTEEEIAQAAVTGQPVATAAVVAPIAHPAAVPDINPDSMDGLITGNNATNIPCTCGFHNQHGSSFCEECGKTLNTLLTIDEVLSAQDADKIKTQEEDKEVFIDQNNPLEGL